MWGVPESLGGRSDHERRQYFPLLPADARAGVNVLKIRQRLARFPYNCPPGERARTARRHESFGVPTVKTGAFRLARSLSRWNGKTPTACPGGRVL